MTGHPVKLLSVEPLFHPQILGGQNSWGVGPSQRMSESVTAEHMKGDVPGLGDLE